jgi:hypothetical protein
MMSRWWQEMGWIRRETCLGDLLAHILNRREHCFATVVFCRPMSGPSRMMKRILFQLSARELKALEGEQMLQRITEIVFDPRAEIVVLDKDRKEVRKPRPPAEPTRPQ